MKVGGKSFAFIFLSLNDGRQYFLLNFLAFGNVPCNCEYSLTSFVVNHPAFHFNRYNLSIFGLIFRFISVLSELGNLLDILFNIFKIFVGLDIADVHLKEFFAWSNPVNHRLSG